MLENRNLPNFSIHRAVISHYIVIHEYFNIDLALIHISIFIFIFMTRRWYQSLHERITRGRGHSAHVPLVPGDPHVACLSPTGAPAVLDEPVAGPVPY